jgi:hypothetical protein
MELLKFINNINDVEENIRNFTGLATLTTPDGAILSGIVTSANYVTVRENSPNRLSIRNSGDLLTTAVAPIRPSLSVSDEFRSEIVEIIRTTIREEIEQIIRQGDS